MKVNVLTGKKQQIQGTLNDSINKEKSLDKEIKTIIADQSEKMKNTFLHAIIIVFKLKLRYYMNKWQNQIGLMNVDTEVIKKILKR